MKHILLLLILMSCAGCVFAQDIISLRDGTNIENVKVQSISDSEVTYTLKNKTISIPRNNVEAVLYEDGRFETISRTLVGDTTSIKAVEQLGYNANELQAMINNGEDRKMLLWQDDSYPNECRKQGKKAYLKVFKNHYKPAFKIAKQSGLKPTEAMQQAIEEAFPAAMKAGNEAVRECNGGM